MGKRIVKKWDLPSEQGKALLILGLCFLAGGVVGTVFAAAVDDPGLQEVGTYLADYIRLSQQTYIRPRPGALLWELFGPVLMLLFFSTTGLGTFAIPLLFIARGFPLAFAVACFVRVLGPVGLFSAFALFVLPALLWVPGMFLVGIPGLIGAYGHIVRRGGEGGRMLLLDISGVRRLFFCCVLLAIAAAIEYWAVPALFPAIAGAVL